MINRDLTFLFRVAIWEELDNCSIILSFIVLLLHPSHKLIHDVVVFVFN